MAQCAYPVLGLDELNAAKVVLRAVLDKRLLVDHDAHKVQHALEGLEIAPVRERELGAKGLGAFVRESDSSRAAALANYPKSGTQRERVLRALAASRASRPELEKRLGLSGNAVRPRVRELLDGGWVQVARDGEGVVLTRLTNSGVRAEVLCLTEYGRREYRRIKRGSGR